MNGIPIFEDDCIRILNGFSLGFMIEFCAKKNMKKHKVFISYHHDNDENYRIKFEELFSKKYDICDSYTVKKGEIKENLPTEEVRRIIREKHLKNSTVTVVLIGEDTWRRKHVDAEISASISQTNNSDRSGLIGLILPNHPDFNQKKYTSELIPQRLCKNEENGYAAIYDWTNDPGIMKERIHKAFLRRDKQPSNKLRLLQNNLKGKGWQ